MEKTKCPFCRKEIEADAIKCPSCGEFTHQPYIPTKEQIAVAQQMVYEGARNQLEKWIKYVFAGSIFMVAAIGAYQFFGFDAIVKTKIVEQVSQKVEPKIDTFDAKLAAVEHKIQSAEEKLSDVRALSNEVGKSAKTIEIIKDEFLDLNSRYRRYLVDVFEAREEQIRNERTRLEESERILRSELLFSPGDEILPLSPVSYKTQLPTTVFGNHAQLEWQDINKNDYDSVNVVYEIQISNDDSFKKHVTSDTTKLTLYPISIDQIKGKTYWRVRGVKTDTSKTDWSPVASFEFYKNAVDRIASTGEIRVGVSSTYEGVFARKDNDGNYIGFDIDVMNLIAEKLSDSFPQLIPAQLDIKYVPFNWRFLLSKPDERKVDLIVSAITINEKRKLRYLLSFSRPYFQSHKVYAMLSSREADIGRPRTWKNTRIKVGVQENTTSEEVVRAFVDDEKVVTFKDTKSMFFDLTRKELDLVVSDVVFAKTNVRDLDIEDKVALSRIELKDFPPGYIGTREEYYGIGMALHEDSLRDMINNVLREMENKKEIDDIRKNYNILELEKK